MKRTPKKESKRRYTDLVVSKLAKDLIEWIDNPTNFWLGDFAVLNNMGRQRFPELAESNKEFGKAYEIAKQIQENRLVRAGLSNQFNSTMVIFSLKNVAGWRDKSEVEHTGNVLHTLLLQLSNEEESPIKKENGKYSTERG